MSDHIRLLAGSAAFDDVEIGYYKNFASKINKDSIFSDSERHISTVGVFR